MPPLSEDNGIRLPLQAAALGDLAGLRGDVVLQRHRRMLKFTVQDVIGEDLGFPRLPTSPFTVHSTIGQRNPPHTAAIVYSEDH